MSDLVSLAEVKVFLKIPVATTGDDTLLTDLLEHAEGVFESDAGRKDTPFTAVASARSEVRDGTGTRHIDLDYDISDVASISLGFDSSDFVETLNPDDADKVVWGTSQRRISRVDGGRFGSADWPRYITVVYDHEADLPEDAQIAVKRLVAEVYRQRGSEEASREQIGTYIRSMGTVTSRFDKHWTVAVEANRRRTFA